MRARHVVWIGLFVIAVLVTLATKYAPYFPGDVEVERGVQSLLPQDVSWAQAVSRTAEFPSLLIVLALVFVFSWILAGWRAALLSLVSVAGMLALGKWLGPVIARPRPSPDLVRVFRPLSGYSFPSLFALRYAAMFGFLAILAAWKGSGFVRATGLVVCSGVLALGFVPRVALAAYWPSDIIISYYLGLLWAAFIIALGSFIRRPPGHT